MLNGSPEQGVFEREEVFLVDLPAEPNLTEPAHVASNSHYGHEFEFLGGLIGFFNPTDYVFECGWEALFLYELDGHLAGGEAHMESLGVPNQYVVLLSVKIDVDVARRLQA